MRKASGNETPRLSEEVLEGFASEGTGGTCYSLTEALGTVLSACSIHARPLTGHMNHGRNIHCALLVENQGKRFIMDPGYVVPGAVPLSEKGEGKLSFSGREMIWKPVSGGWELHTVENGRDQLRYRLESRVLTRGEFLEYWRNSFSATGLNSLHLNLAGPEGGRISAHNENLRIIAEGSGRNIKIGKDYAASVKNRFGLSDEIAEAAWRELQRQRRERS
ncbi:hypothetical protein CSA37_03980 [Candidatus Fermentibacteria bacterium]|nr:MAG: hypothetical protein CSA37_10735 [Candidatus Fermentibacteria bacterium]PIE52811.1 MAG: hypothetical protein CSA37_03980 [Candidatus Fermentibacteria bacterium]